MGLMMSAATEKRSDKGSSGSARERAGKLFGDIANRTSQAAGRALTFMIAAAVVIIWAITGPIFHYSDTWQLVINTGTTIVTFLMVFLIQNSQNRDSIAIQAKLDELIRAGKGAKNEMIGLEDLSCEELESYHAHFSKLAEDARAKLSQAVAESHGAAKGTESAQEDVRNLNAVVR